MKLPPASWIAATIGKQIVTEIGRPEVSNRGALSAQPPFRRVTLAILLLRPVLRCDELRRQRQDLLVAGSDQAGTKQGVEVFGAPISAPPRRALFAFDLSRAEVLAPVERDRHSPVQTLELRQRPCGLDRFEEQPVERRRRSAVQHQADVVVGGDRRHAEQRLAV
jgi:hypothetical protein